MLMPHFQGWMESYSINSSHRILCAISGGLDSMVMLHLFLACKIRVEVMHMNYQLRGEASDLDQALVEDICAKHKIKCHTRKVTKPSNCNTQEWARNARYGFIAELDKNHQYDFIATAHHKQDQLETILLSIFKGYSLQTIKPERNKFLRPLLSVDKQDIYLFASANEIEYRQDQSNFSNNYDRNYLRNEIIPSLRNRFDNFDKRVVKFAERQMDQNHLTDTLIDEKIDRFSTVEFNNLKDYQYQKIHLDILKENEGFAILSKYLKKQFGFNPFQTQSLITSQDPAAEIHSNLYTCLKSKTHLHIGLSQAEDEAINIQAEDLPFKNKNLVIQSTDILEKPQNGSLIVDFEILKFPITVRKVRKGDKFHAFGLRGKSTSLSKFLKDKGIPPLRRRHDYVLIDDSGKIIIPGIEIDYALKITNTSKTALIVALQDKTNLRFLDTNED